MMGSWIADNNHFHDSGDSSTYFFARKLPSGQVEVNLISNDWFPDPDVKESIVFDPKEGLPNPLERVPNGLEVGICKLYYYVGTRGTEAFLEWLERPYTENLENPIYKNGKFSWER